MTEKYLKIILPLYGANVGASLIMGFTHPLYFVITGISIVNILLTTATPTKK